MIAIIENIRVALTGLGANKLRAGLTMLGISIGVAAVIVLVSLGQAVQDYVADQFLGIGTNLAYIIPSSFATSSGSGVQSANQFSTVFSSLTARDAATLSDPFNVPDAKVVVPVLGLQRAVTNSGNQMRSRVDGTTSDYFT